jgi:hypothetical protein
MFVEHLQALAEHGQQFRLQYLHSVPVVAVAPGCPGMIVNRGRVGIR